jgi:K+-transporting ATPase ATPase B chain
VHLRLRSKPESKQDGAQLISRGARSRPLFDPEIVKRATKESFVKLNPMLVAKNPVMFVVEVGAALITIYVIKDMFTHAGNLLFGVQIALWLWFTVLFANFAEAMAEARGKAQADALRKTKVDTMARKICPTAQFEMCLGRNCARTTWSFAKPAT